MSDMQSGSHFCARRYKNFGSNQMDFPCLPKNKIV